LVVTVLVQGTLVLFLIKYRRRKNPKAVFTHGNTRVEKFWTIGPAIILVGMSLASIQVWNLVRAEPADDPDRVRILVIAFCVCRAGSEAGAVSGVSQARRCNLAGLSAGCE
jgi:heme/copper-type cytochrome/quinol oxidase subunit 2